MKWNDPEKMERSGEDGTVQMKCNDPETMQRFGKDALRYQKKLLEGVHHWRWHKCATKVENNFQQIWSYMGCNSCGFLFTKCRWWGSRPDICSTPGIPKISQLFSRFSNLFLMFEERFWNYDDGLGGVLKMNRLCRWRTDIWGTRGIPKGGTTQHNNKNNTST